MPVTGKDEVVTLGGRKRRGEVPRPGFLIRLPGQVEPLQTSVLQEHGALL